MSKRFDRFVSLVGRDGLETIRSARFAVIGIGGVGGAAAEALIRYGVGHISFVDGDVFEESNLNRQIFCDMSTIGMNKAEAARNRALAIDPDIDAIAYPMYFTPSTADEILRGADFCLDAIDDIDNKVALICECARRGIPIVSAMGAGNRLDCGFCMTDIYKTSYDPFAKTLRKKLKSAGINSLDVCCASSAAVVPDSFTPGLAPASAAAPPMVMGAMLANHAIGKVLKLC